LSSTSRWVSSAMPMQARCTFISSAWLQRLA
jgi:hypothetical protein